MRVVLRCPPALEGRLPQPVAARDGLPEWLRRMPAATLCEDLGFEVRTVKQCPPFIDAMAMGFVMPLAADLRVADGEFAWDWEAPVEEGTAAGYTRSPVSFHFGEQAAGVPYAPEDALVVKFNSFWTIGLPAGWSVLVTHPVNREELPFRTLTGLVDADRFSDAFVHFPALWRDPDFEGLLPAGTPVAQCIPVRREPLELDLDVLAGESAERFMAVQTALEAEPGVYRKRFRAKRG